MRQQRKPIIGLLNNKRRQFNYGFLNIFASILVILVINTIYLYKFSETTELCVHGDGVDFSRLSEHFGYLLSGSIVAILLSGGMCFGFAILLTHRFYGPMVPILRHLEEMKKGNYTSRIRLRKKDELHDLSEKLNDLTAHLEGTSSASAAPKKSNPEDPT